MRKSIFLSGFLLAALLPISSCSDDTWPDVDGADPTFELRSSHIKSEQGRTITLSGTVADADGISTIKLVCHELNLNKTIDLIDIYGEPQKSYDLEYNFTVQDNETGDNFNIDITVTDVGGRSVTKHVLLTLDGDYTAPVFTAAPDKELTVLIKEKTMFNLKFTVEDNKAIDYVEVDMEGVAGFPVRIEGGESQLNYSNKLELPGKAGSYNLTITAYDKPAQDDEVRSTSISSVVNVSELPDFEKMYLADVATAAELNSDLFGVPMLIDHVGAYQYRARYYNETAGTEICFIPQKTDFSPICFAPDSTDSSIFGDDPESVGRLKLEKPNVYYEITFNTKTGAYSTRTYETTSSEAMDPIFWDYGSNNMNKWWNFDQQGPEEWVHSSNATLEPLYIGYATGPNDVTTFVQDSKNKHLYYFENPITLSAGQEMGFIVHNYHGDGWWNYITWRVDDSVECERFAYYGSVVKESYLKWAFGDDCDFTKWCGGEDYRKQFIGDNWCRPVVTTSGKYQFYFDSHLGRGKMVRVN